MNNPLFQCQAFDSSHFPVQKVEWTALQKKPSSFLSLSSETFL